MANGFKVPLLSEEEEQQEQKQTFSVPLLSQSEEDYKFNDVLSSNKDKQFIDRIINPEKYPTPTLTDEQGRKQTHFMSADLDENNNWVVYPKIVLEDGEYKRVNMQQAIASGNSINFGEDKDLAQDFSQNYKTKKFKDFYSEDKPAEETPISRASFQVPLLKDENEEGINPLSVFKFRKGKKIYDTVQMSAEMVGNLPGQIVRSQEKAAIEDLINDINVSLGEGDRSILDEFALQGSGFVYEYTKQQLENELGLADRNNLQIYWNTLFGTDEALRQFNIKQLSREEKIQARNELLKKNKEQAELITKENNAYAMKKQKLWQERGYTSEEIAVVGAVSSTAPSLAMWGAAVGLKKPGLALTSAPFFGLVSTRSSYEEGIAKGLTDADARYNSFIQGGSEMATELLPGAFLTKSASRFVKGNKQSIKNLLSEGTGFLVRETGGEELNTLIQSLSDAYFDNQDELRIAFENRDNPLYEGPSSSEIITERMYLTLIGGLAAGGAMATTTGAIKYNASKNWIKQSNDPQTLKDNIDKVVMQKALDDVAFEQAAIKSVQDEYLNDPNVDPMELVAEQILKIEGMERSQDAVSGETFTDKEPINQVSNMDEALTNVGKFLEAKGYNLDKMDLGIGKSVAAQENEQAADMIYFMGGMKKFNVDFDNVQDTANQIDEFILDSNLKKTFAVKKRPPLKERIEIPEKPKEKRARSYAVRKMSNIALQQEEIVRALTGGGEKIPPVYRTPLGTRGWESVDYLGEALYEAGFFPGKESYGAVDPQEVLDLLYEDPVDPASREALDEYQRDVDGLLVDYINNNPNVTFDEIRNATTRGSSVDLKESLRRLVAMNAIEESSLTGEYTYKLVGAVEEIKSEVAGPEFTYEESSETSVPITLQDFEKIPKFPADEYFNEADKLPVYPEHEKHKPKNSVFKPRKSKKKSPLDEGFNITDDKWSLLDESQAEVYRQELEFMYQNVLGRIKVVEKAIEAYDKRFLTTSEKPSEAFVRLPGALGTELRKALEEGDTIAQKVVDAGLYLDDVDMIARALHAPERNQSIYKDKLAKIDDLVKKAGKAPTDAQKQQIEKAKKQAEFYKDNASGIQTNEAIKILDDYGIKFDGIDATAINDQGQTLLNAVEAYYEYIRNTVDLYNKSGLIEGSVAEDYKSGEKWKWYVPLSGFAADTNIDGKPNKQGKGLSIRGLEDQKAVGRKSLSASPFIQILNQRQRAIQRSLKNDAMVRLADLFRGKYQNNDVAQVVEIKPEKMELVFGFKEDGKQKWLEVYDERLGRALNSYDGAVLDQFSRTMRKFTRLQSALYTAFSPAFILFNFSRDLITGGISLYAEQNLPGGRAAGKKLVTKTMKNVIPRLGQFHKGILGREITEEGIQEAYDLYNEYGANSGFVTQLGEERLQKHFEAFKTKYDGKAELRDSKNLALKVTGPMKEGFNATRDFIYDLNSAVENGIRFSAFVEFIKDENNGQISGASKQTLESAASLAKQLTIDYTTKGYYSNMINSHFIFFNAAVQSNVPLYRALAKSPKVAAQIGGGTAAFGALLTLYNYMISDDDETGRPIYENIAERYGNRYIIVMLPGVKEKDLSGLPDTILPGRLKLNGKTIAFAYPQPLGFNIPYNLGRQGVELSAHQIFKHNTPGKSLARASLEMFDNLSTGVLPLGVNISRKEGIEGFASTVLRTATPSYAKPLIEIAVNENFFNVPITKQLYGGQKGLPNSSVATSYDREIYISMAQIINNMTGGDNEMLEKGWVDLQPGQIKYITEYYGGGPLSFATKTYDAMFKFANDIDIKDVKEIPFLNTYAVQEQDGVYARRFYSAMQETEELITRYKNIEDPERAREFLNKNKNVIKLGYVDDMQALVIKQLPKEVRPSFDPVLKDIKRRMNNFKDSEKTIRALRLRKTDPNSYDMKMRKIQDEKRDMYFDFLKEYEKAKKKDLESQD